MNAESGAIAARTPDLPLAFARRHGVLLRGVNAGVATVALRPDATALAVSEARRHLRHPLALERVSTERFEELLREAYDAGTDARAAAGGLEETTDLSFLAQELPER
ncbi:MAG: type II secretion system protein GspE, partial [Gammaproteobacteria bacterium]|nr:type II secretion system protein GspE [Gammaproteobacteria bacterium]